MPSVPREKLLLEPRRSRAKQAWIRLMLKVLSRVYGPRPNLLVYSPPPVLPTCPSSSRAPGRLRRILPPLPDSPAATRLLPSSCVCHGSRSTPPPPQALRWSRSSRLARRRHHRPPLSPSLVSPLSPARSNLRICARSHFAICVVLGMFGLCLNCFWAISIETVKRPSC